jgi:hypothetical protein
VGIDVLRKVTFYFVCLKIWYREVLFLWQTVNLDAKEKGVGLAPHQWKQILMFAVIIF